MKVNDLLNLMGITYLPKNLANKVRYSPETSICVEFADRLRGMTFAQELRCVWFHPANEVVRTGKNLIFGYVLKRMGKMAGIPDYIFLWKGGCGCMEFKSEKGRQTENQKLFEKWCISCEVPYEVVTSVENGLALLKEWGAIL